MRRRIGVPVDAEMADKVLGIREEPGWIGPVCRGQALGAIPNGTRIVKAAIEIGDSHKIGALGTVLGSLSSPPAMRVDFPDVDYVYCIEWDDSPKTAVFIVNWKIQRANP